MSAITIILRDCTAAVAAWAVAVLTLGRLCTPGSNSQATRQGSGPPVRRRLNRDDFVLAA